MITPNQEQHLGQKAFIFTIVKSVFAGLALLIATIILSVLRGILASRIQSPGFAGIFDLVLLGLFILTVIVFAAGIIISWLAYQNHTFTVQEFDLKIKRGILNKEEISIPYRQIQDVDIERSILYGLLGISRLVIITAGEEKPAGIEETSGILDPIDKELAEEIQNNLQEKIGIQTVETEAKTEAKSEMTS